MQRSRKEGPAGSADFSNCPWLRGSGTTDGQLAGRWAVYLSREPFAERRPCTGHLRGPQRPLGALTRPVHQPRRGCQHRGRRRCRLSALIPRAGIRQEVPWPRQWHPFKGHIDTRSFKPSAEGSPPPGGCKSNKCNTPGARGSRHAVFICGYPDCLCVSV